LLYKKLNSIKPVFAAIALVSLLAFFISGQVDSQIFSNQTVKTDSIPEEVSVLPEIQEVITKYDSAISFEIKNTQTVGAAVAVIYKNQIVYLKCFGLRQIKTKDSIDENTIFRLASVSKTISATLAGMLIADSTVSLDDKVVKYLPGFKLKSEEQTQLLSLRNILSHTSGMPQHTYDDLVEQKVPQGQIIQKLAEVGPASKPGAMYAYQNVMYSLFDTIVAAKTGKNYGEVLKEKVFEPFSMNNASVGFQAFVNNPDKAIPHSSGRSGFRITPLNDRYYNTLAAAGINASISDMAQFVKHLLSDSAQLVNSARDIIFEPQIPSRLSAGYFSQWETMGTKYYGLGWRVINYKGRRVVYHGGFLKGYRAEIAICKNENIGIVYLSNSPSLAAARSVPLFLNQFFESKDLEKLVDKPKEPQTPQGKS